MEMWNLVGEPEISCTDPVKLPMDVGDGVVGGARPRLATVVFLQNSHKK